MATWGDTTTGTGTFGMGNLDRLVIGYFNPGSAQQLDSVHFYLSPPSSITYRWVVAVNNTNDMSTPTVLEEGTFTPSTGAGWKTVTSSTNPIITDGQYVIIGIKTAVVSAGTIGRTTAPTGDITDIYANVDDDNTATSPWSFDAAGATVGWSESMYITHSALPAGGIEVLRRRIEGI